MSDDLRNDQVVSKAREADLEARLISVIHAFDDLKVKLTQLEGENHAYKVQSVQLKGEIMVEREKQEALKRKCRDLEAQIRSLKSLLKSRGTP